jgi:hypothetical protein
LLEEKAADIDGLVCAPLVIADCQETLLAHLIEQSLLWQLEVKMTIVIVHAENERKVKIGNIVALFVKVAAAFAALRLGVRFFYNVFPLPEVVAAEEDERHLRLD